MESIKSVKCISSSKIRFQVEPYQILQINSSSSNIICDAKESLRNKISTATEQEKIMLTLSYEILLENKAKLSPTITQYQYKLPKQDIHKLALAGQLQEITALIEGHPELLWKQDQFGRDALYIAIRSGYIEIVNQILKHSIKLNEQFVCKSTYLHVASFYGHMDIVKLLLIAGAPQIPNQYGSLPSEEAYSSDIESIILNAKSNALYYTIQDCAKSGLISYYQEKFVQGYQPVAYRFYRRAGTDEGILNALCTNEILYHGTQLENVKTILENGLLPPGTEVNGKELEPPSYHIPLGEKVYGVSNYPNAIFTSKSLYYASHYADTAMDLMGNKMKIILECYVDQQNLKIASFENTLNKYVPIKNDTNLVETRIPPNLQKNIVVTGLVLVNSEYFNKCISSYTDITKKVYLSRYSYSLLKAESSKLVIPFTPSNKDLRHSSDKKL